MWGDYQKKILLEEKAYNIEQCVVPSEIAVVDRMLANRVELEEAYEELHAKFHNPRGIARCSQRGTAHGWALESGRY